MPDADQREARQGRKLRWVFPSEEGFGFWVFHARNGACSRSPANGRRDLQTLRGAFRFEALEELALGALHRQRRFGVGLELSEAIQLRQRDVWPQVILAAG